MTYKNCIFITLDDEYSGFEQTCELQWIFESRLLGRRPMDGNSLGWEVNESKLPRLQLLFINKDNIWIRHKLCCTLLAVCQIIGGRSKRDVIWYHLNQITSGSMISLLQNHWCS